MITGQYNNTGFTIFSDGEQVAQTVYVEIVDLELAKADCKKECTSQGKARNEGIMLVRFKMHHGTWPEEGEK